MAGFVNHAWPAQAQHISISTASVAQVSQGVNGAEGQLILSKGASARANQARSKHASEETDYDNVQQNPIMNSAARLLVPNDFPTVAELTELFKQHPRSVSIAIRLSKPTDFASAILFYRTALAKIVSGSDSIVTDDQSESYRLPMNNSYVELLILFQASPKPRTDCTIVYMALDNTIDDINSMRREFRRLIDNSHGRFRAIEGPAVGLRGSRDDKKPKKAHRAVYEIINTGPPPPGQPTKVIRRIGKTYEGVIINPPIP